MRSAPTFKRLVAWGAVPLGLLGSVAMVWQASSSTFAATTVDPASSWSTGALALGDDDSGTALFTVTTMKPGATGTRCIAVTSTGTLPSAVRLYASGYATTKSLASSITLTITEGTGGSFSSCTGFSSTGQLYNGTLDAFGTGDASYATGVSSWAPTGSGSETRTYRFAWTLSSSVPDTVQGGTSSLAFTWQAQNT